MSQFKFFIIIISCHNNYSPMLHARHMAFIARIQASASWVNFSTGTNAIERCMIKWNWVPVGTLCELIFIGKVASCAIWVDSARMHKLWKWKEAISRISCNTMQQFSFCSLIKKLFQSIFYLWNKTFLLLHFELLQREREMENLYFTKSLAGERLRN